MRASTDPVIRLVICDAGPLIHLDELGCLDLLSSFAVVLIPDTVWEEVLHHRPQGMEGGKILSHCFPCSLHPLRGEGWGWGVTAKPQRKNLTFVHTPYFVGHPLVTTDAVLAFDKHFAQAGFRVLTANG